MLNLSLSARIPSVESTASILRNHLGLLGVPVDYDKVSYYYYYHSNRALKAYNILIQATGLSEITPTIFANYLRNHGIKDGFLRTKTGNMSLSAESVSAALATGFYTGDAEKLLKIYRVYAESSFYSNGIRTFVYDYPISNLETYDNHRMILVRPEVVAQNTGRLGYRNPAVQNIFRGFKDIITCPKGWVLFDYDSGQVEPRIIYSQYIKDPQIQALINLYNDAYYGLLHYVTMPDEYITNKRMDFVPFEIDEEKKALRKRLKTYGNAVMYGSTKNTDNDPLKAQYIKRIGGHPERIKLQRSAEQLVSNGMRTVYSAFGTPINIEGGSNDAWSDMGDDDDSYVDHLVKCAINNQIQSTAADLMRYSVSQANTILMDDAPNSCILAYIHDSGKFAIHESDYDRVADRIREIVAYQVDDWIPIYADGEEGRAEGSLEDKF